MLITAERKRERTEKTMNRRILITSIAILLLSISIPFVFATVFNDTFDTATPAGTDSPTEADDRMREIKAAVQERENVDHYWPLDGTEVSDADAGEHRKVLFHEPIDATPTVAESHGDLRIKDVSGKAELHWTDEDENEVQLTDAGEIAQTTPSGVISAFAGSSAPSGWLICDGSTGLSTVANPEYTALFAIIGTTYGGTGTTDFDLPDLRGRTPIGLDSGFVNVTTPTAGSLGETAAGEENHQLTEAELAAHNHTIRASSGTAGSTSPNNNVHAANGGVFQYSGSGTINVSMADAGMLDAGSDSEHNNMQPYLTLNFIIKI